MKQNVETVPMNLKHNDRMVLVKYGDIMSVWDSADCIWLDLGE